MSALIGILLIIVGVMSIYHAAHFPPHRKHDRRSLAWFMAGILSFLIGAGVMWFGPAYFRSWRCGITIIC